MRSFSTGETMGDRLYELAKLRRTAVANALCAVPCFVATLLSSTYAQFAVFGLATAVFVGGASRLWICACRV